MRNYSTGNRIVDEVGEMSFVGNIIPDVWYHTITKENGHANLNAIVLLAEIVYWYRPTEVKDELSGRLTGMKKKFRDDLLQKDYQQMAEHHGMSKIQVINAIKELEKIGVIKRVFRNLKVKGRCVNNVLYIQLNPQKLRELTYPKEQKEQTIPIFKEGGGNIEIGILPILNEVEPYPNMSTNTKITTENTIEDYPIYPSTEESKKIDTMDVINTYRFLIQKNIEYEHLLQTCKVGEKEYINEILELLVETVSIERETVRIGGVEYPYQVVKSAFLKLNSSHITYVLWCMEKNTSKVRNIRAYLLTALYNAPNTIDSYYRAEVNHDMYGEV
ncbi:MAG: DNA replication protein DnaD [Lachnospiraceae bacterium]|nr:DNA replication protein DnaD [Lachnospiraceae bacterium]